MTYNKIFVMARKSNEELRDEYNRRRLTSILKQPGCGGVCHDSIGPGNALDIDCPVFARGCSGLFIKRHKKVKGDTIEDEWKKLIKDTAVQIYLETYGEEALFEALL
jgi:hypothetical protein